MSHKTSAGLLIALLAAQTHFAPSLFANSIRYDFLQGSTTTVVGGSPLVTAIFEDVAPNQVNLTITAPGLTGNSFLRALYFNLDPTMSAPGLTFNQTASSGGVPAAVLSSNDSFKTGGGGKFDVKITFATAPVFIAGNSVVYSITGLAGISAESFAFQDTVSAGSSQSYAAASIQFPTALVVINSTPESSSVPDTGATVWLLVLALLALGLVSRGYRFVPSLVPARAGSAR